MTSLRYLTFDSLAEGVGASQVLPYAERLAATGLHVELHTFEKVPVDAAVRDRLDAAGVCWTPHPFGAGGAPAGAARVARGARILRGASLVHARSDLPAASALLARTPRWVWDVRSFWTDQRIALGNLSPGSAEERLLRLVERRAARHSGAITALSAAAVDTLADRFGEAVRAKAWVIPTCVDLATFPVRPMPPPNEGLTLLFSGTLNSFYDMPCMLRLVDRLNQLVPARLKVLAPAVTAYDRLLAQREVTVLRPTRGDIPAHLAAGHAGLCVCRFDAGPSLRAAVPTKVGEFLATGRPVVVNRGLGDLDTLLAGSGAGVVVQDASDDAAATAAAELWQLVQDPETPARARRLAEVHFDLGLAVTTLQDVYRYVAERC